MIGKVSALASRIQGFLLPVNDKGIHGLMQLP
jgi:hypothetical protein